MSNVVRNRLAVLAGATAVLAVLAVAAVVVVVLVTGRSLGIGGCGPSVSDGTFRTYDRPRMPLLAPGGGLWEVYTEETSDEIHVNQEHDGRWRALPGTPLDGQELRDLALSADGHLLAALSGPTTNRLVLSDGHTWQSYDVPRTAGYRPSVHVAAIRSGRDAWALGRDIVDPRVIPQATPRTRPLALHWDGSGWRATALPPGEVDLTGALDLGPDDVWAAGDLDGPDAGPTPAVLHWDGRSWSRVAVPAGRGTVDELTGTHAGDVWAMTEDDQTHARRLLHWDGTRWSETATPAGHVLDAVAVGCGGLWAIGSDRSPGSYELGFRTGDGQWSFRRTPTYSHQDCPVDGLLGGPDRATLWLDIACSRPDSTGESIVTDHRVTFS